MLLKFQKSLYHTKHRLPAHRFKDPNIFAHKNVCDTLGHAWIFLAAAALFSFSMQCASKTSPSLSSSPTETSNFQTQRRRQCSMLMFMRSTSLPLLLQTRRVGTLCCLSYQPPPGVLH
ncbi:hypothetical protein MCOR27_006569 [Pyricularia oryzae]|uniref:Uncharacterized protein n=1 Tax=Pyricularia grisea TaxID=148305 RepID=A0ABQ8NH83_PYRGI|nr:hypothetical protein MCOR01_001590 [Pyricularia oryzae]KAI6297075.1 hypothetical protein MCOR33_006531 [Pyricularia grisea]KAH9429856.1 hypothetical protein MCOR02_009586 [Pyricularia oryzae]KAI6257873.1 hypothetical protein MCOR19_005747 [Pyricularia oryzae]KAI6274845.1 hypothetical protein MCOR26_006301 [Pyricularia oryzae]